MNGTILRNAIHISAVFAFYLATIMLIPGLVDLYYANPDWKVFAASAFGIGGISALIAVATRSGPPAVSTRFTFLLVNMLWITFVTCGTVPLALSSLELTMADAFFEAVSAATGTGATVLSGLDTMAPGILLWRSLLQWVGGLGVIVLGLFILPFLKIGGSSFFKIESSDRYDRPFARFTTYATSVVLTYSLLTLICAVLYAWFGMSGFDAINHAMTTLATGGMSTHDNSFAFFNEQLHWISMVFMMIGAMPFTIIVVMALRGRFDSFKDSQVLTFVAYTLLFSIIMTVYLSYTGLFTGVDALYRASFTLVSIITTTGYSNDDYMQWGPFIITMIFFVTLMGGCSGSTSGGVKTWRWIILFGIIKRSLETFIYPNAVRPVRSGSVPVPDQVQFVALMFLSTYGLIIAICTILVASTGTDIVTALTASMTSVSNVGPGLGDIIGPVGNFASLPEAAKYILSLAMIFGRLEIFTVLVLFSPTFWRE